MSDCDHLWEMTNIQYGFIVFEKCYHCSQVKTYFSEQDRPTRGDEYKDGDHYWSVMENAQSFQFDLRCKKCGQIEPFHDLMGLLQCTECLPDCEVRMIQRKLSGEKTWIMVAFGFLPEAKKTPIPAPRLEILSDYFNQRRDTSRSRIKIVSFNLITDVTLCRGEFIYDIGMLSPEEIQDRKPLL
jgi:hypothetical protein